MDVLVAYESSGTVRRAFQAKGHNAYSCDLLPADDGETKYHLKMDARDAIRKGWDLIIAHPPCTTLCISGNRHYGEGTPGYSQRLMSIHYTMEVWQMMKHYADQAALENPIGVLTKYLGKPQYIQPWQFGHDETKKTCLWLHNLPPLIYSCIHTRRENRIHNMGQTKDRWKKRSKTFEGIAKAMAEQWS